MTQVPISATDGRSQFSTLRIHQLFEEQAERTPNHVAVVCGGKTATFRELNARANQLAYHLRASGIGPDVLVAICVHRSLDMVVGVLGILKAGAGWLPLDPVHPRERLQIELRDARVSVLLTQKSLLADLPVSDRRTVLLDEDSASIARHGTENPQNTAEPSHLAYTIFTSGSTGRPKGVMITHANLSHYAHAMHESLGIDPNDIYLHTASFAFSSSVRQLMVPLTRGATVVIATADEVRQPLLLFEMVKRLKVTIIDVVPSYLRNCLHLIEGLGAQSRKDLLDNQLRLVLTASEPLLTDLPGKWTFELKHKARLINMFGQTETTGIVAIYPIPQNPGPKSKTVPIGRPIRGTEIHLLDEHKRPVPTGVAGEIYVSGAGVGRGYLNEPELTAERFLPSLLNRKADGLFYRTGDLGRYGPDGNLEFLGRIDDQVKIRGIRIELGEVEAVLSEHTGIQETVVIARRDEAHNESLVAYIVPKPGQTPLTTELRDFLKKKLPDYMLPSAFVFMRALPRTPNGKVNRRAVPVSCTSSEPERAIVAPRNPMELQLTRMWGLLGIPCISVLDNFFDIGGHSLLAARLCVEIGKTFGKNLPPDTLLKAPTVEQLASVLAKEELPASASSAIALQPSGSKLPYFWVYGEASDVFLPRYLGSDQPLYGFTHQSSDGKPALYACIEDMAAHYLREIRSIQPRGPYFLGGHCFGGMVAFEMAQQLRRHDEVALLVLVNPPALSRAVQHPSSRRSLSEEVRRHFRALELLTIREKIDYVLERAKGTLDERLVPARKAFMKLACAVYLKLGYLLPVSLRSFYILKVYREARLAYTPQVYPGRLIILEGSDDLLDADSWEKLATEGLDVRKIPGNHETVLKEPHVRGLAEALRACLETAQTASQRQDRTTAP